MFFSIFKIDFFPGNWKNVLILFWFWNYSWWSTIWPEKIFLKAVHSGFKNRQKVVFISLKKHQKVFNVRRYWLFSNFLFWFEFLSLRYIFPENLACTRSLFTKIDSNNKLKLIFNFFKPLSIGKCKKKLGSGVEIKFKQFSSKLFLIKWPESQKF